MAAVFDIADNKVILKASSLVVPEFKKIWDRDKSKGKDQAYKELSYVVFLCDYSIDNPYRSYSEYDREKILRTDFLEEEEPDELILKAVTKYKELSETVSLRLVKRALSAADTLGEYFDQVNFNDKDKMGKPIYSSKELSSNLKDIGQIVKSLETLEEQLLKKQSSSKIRGGGDIGDYEIKDRNFNYGE